VNNSFAGTTPEQKIMILRAEIMTPLTIIEGCTALLQKHYEREKPTSEDLWECIHGIQTSVDRIKSLLNETESKS
jgi:signal transduction histidine kinase